MIQNNLEPKNAAVTFGRYNTTTIAHMDTIKTMASQFGSVIVGVIDSDAAVRCPDLPKKFRRFYDLADIQHTKTTLSLEERTKLLELSVADEALSDRVTVVTIPRPEYSVEEFNNSFPTDKYQLTFPCPIEGQAAEFDNLRDITLRQILGRTTLGISVALTFHTSDIKVATADQPDKWSEYMTPNAYDYFASIDGPKRIGV